MRALILNNKGLFGDYFSPSFWLWWVVAGSTPPSYTFDEGMQRLKPVCRPAVAPWNLLSLLPNGPPFEPL